MAVTRITHRPMLSHVKESKNSLGFWIPSRGFRIRATLPGTNRAKVPTHTYFIFTGAVYRLLIYSSVYEINVYNLRLLHSIWTHARYCFEKILLSWILLKWPPYIAPLSKNDPPKANQNYEIDPQQNSRSPPSSILTDSLLKKVGEK